MAYKDSNMVDIAAQQKNSKTRKAVNTALDKLKKPMQSKQVKPQVNGVAKPKTTVKQVKKMTR